MSNLMASRASRHTPALSAGIFLEIRRFQKQIHQNSGVQRLNHLSSPPSIGVNDGGHMVKMK